MRFYLFVNFPKGKFQIKPSFFLHFQAFIIIYKFYLPNTTKEKFSGFKATNSNTKILSINPSILTFKGCTSFQIFFNSKYARFFIYFWILVFKQECECRLGWMKDEQNRELRLRIQFKTVYWISQTHTWKYFERGTPARESFTMSPLFAGLTLALASGRTRQWQFSKIIHEVQVTTKGEDKPLQHPH